MKGKEALIRHVKLNFVLMSVFLVGSIASAAGQEVVRAKIGMEILSGDSSRLAKSRDRLKAGNQLRIYVMPEKDSYIYVINADRKHAVLLNPKMAKQKFSKGSLEVFPSKASLYDTGESENRESFTVVCSLQPLAEITDLFAPGAVPFENWMSLEKKLSEKSKISLGEKIDKPFAMAGTVRTGGSSEKVAGLKVYSGIDLLVKSYQFQIKK